MSLLPPEVTPGISGRLPAVIGGIVVDVVAVVVAHDAVDQDGADVVGAAHDEVDAQFGRLCNDNSDLALSPPTCFKVKIGYIIS